MMLISGKEIARSMRDELAAKLKKLDFPYQPILCDVVIGDDPVSLSYVKVKKKAAESIGLAFKLVQLPELSTTDEVIYEIQKIQADPHLCGLIVQLPVPEHINKQTVLDAILPEIDVDCIGAYNHERFYKGQGGMVPPTAAAIMHILSYLFSGNFPGYKKAAWHDKKYAVIGQGELVGKPTAYMLKQKGLHVITADKETSDLPGLTRSADILISGTGIAELITGRMIKDGAVVIDAGTSVQ